MPGLNFDYTQFLKRQNQLYLLKYQNDPVEVGTNPQPKVGFSGHHPSYRGSVADQRVVRSLVRCLTSPMKPTTATGYRVVDKSLPNVAPGTADAAKRAQSAPPATAAVEEKPAPSRVSMISAGSSNSLMTRPRTSALSCRQPTPAAGRSSRASTVSLHKVQKLPARAHPEGYPGTLYGSCFTYAWPDQRASQAVLDARPKSFAHDRALDRAHGVIYHKHEGVVPKFLGYVPGYKFRHGSTYGLLTVNPNNQCAVHRRPPVAAS